MSRARMNRHQRNATGVTTVKVANATRDALVELARKMTPEPPRFRFSRTAPMTMDDVVYRLALAELDRLDAEGGK